MLEHAFRRIGRVRFGAQDLALLGRHGQCQIGEHRAVEIVDQLLVRHLVVIGEAPPRPQPPLGLDDCLADFRRPAFVFVGVDVPLPGNLVERGRHRFEVLTRGRLMALHPHRVVTAVVHLEHGVRQAVIDEGRQFGMDRGQVIALVEIVADDLPVELRVGGDVEHPDPVFEPIALQPLWIGGQPFEQRRHVVVHAPEDERAPRLAAQLGQVDLAARVAAGKIVRVLHLDQRARRIELPSVV